MAATGTITINGKPYTWTSPTFETMEHFEATIGQIVGSRVADTFRGRTHLLCACLKENHPDVTPGVIGKELRTTDWDAVWDVIRQAAPLWALPKAEEDAGRKQPSDTPTEPGDGDHPKPGESA